MFRHNFGGGGFPRQQQQGGVPEPAQFRAQLLHLVPIVAMLLFTFFSFRPSEPVSSHPLMQILEKFCLELFR